MRLCLALAVLIGTTGATLQTQSGYVRTYDPVTDTTIESLSLINAGSPLRLFVTAVYAGQRRRAPLKRVEILVTVPASLVVADVPTLEASVSILVDGHPFRRGPLNAQDVAQSRPGVAMVVGFDAFNELAHARTIAGRAFGIDFSVPAERLVALQEIAERWALPE